MRKEGWKGRLNTFLDDLEMGKFDPDLNEPDGEPSSPVKENPTNDDTKAESNGTAAPTTIDDTKPTVGEDDLQFNVDADEEAADGDAPRVDANGKASSDNKRQARGEEVSVPPEGNQVMIRTIPPDIGRVKLEEVRLLPTFLCFSDVSPGRLARKSLVLFTLHLVILCKSAITIVLVGFVSQTMRICPLSCRS